MAKLAEIHADKTIMADQPAPDEGRLGIGGNNPPEPTPFDAIAVHIGDLFEEAKNWADGALIDSQAQADLVQTLMRQIQEAHNVADLERIKENIPFDEGKKAVQAKYAPLIADTKTIRGKTVMAIAALKQALAPWLVKLEDDRKAEAKRLRDEADAAEQAARDAAQAAQATNDLAATEAAEEAFTGAKAASREATRVENARPQAAGYGRAAALRDNWAPILVDGTVALRHYWVANRPALEACALQLAKTDVLNGKRSIPGFDVINTPVVV